MHLAAFSLISILGFLFLAGPELVEAESLHGDGPSAATFPKDGVATMKLNWNRGTPMAYGAFVGKGFEMTGRNPENNTGPAIEGILVNFNRTYFSQNATTTRWVAFIVCDNTTSTVDLIANAGRLGAQAILTFSNVFRFCVVDKVDPPSPIPIYSVESGGGSLREVINPFFEFSNIRQYNSTKLDAIAKEAEDDLRLLNVGSGADSKVPLKSGTLLVRFERNVTVAATTSAPPTRQKSAAREMLSVGRYLASNVLSIGLLFAMGASV